MAITLSGSTGVTYPAGGLDNVAGAGVGTTDTQTLTNKTLTSPTIGGTPVMGASVITSGTAQASTSGTSIDFTSIPSWVKRITVVFNEVSTNGNSVIQVQLGTGGVPTTSGYLSTKTEIQASTTVSSITSGHSVVGGSAANVASGLIVFALVSGNIFIGSSSVKQSTTFMSIGNSSVTLAGTLNFVRITTVNGTDTFDAGSINILYE
jgi:hypothetical protein